MSGGIDPSPALGRSPRSFQSSPYGLVGNSLRGARSRRPPRAQDRRLSSTFCRALQRQDVPTTGIAVPESRGGCTRMPFRFDRFMPQPTLSRSPDVFPTVAYRQSSVSYTPGTSYIDTARPRELRPSPGGTNPKALRAAAREGAHNPRPVPCLCLYNTLTRRCRASQRRPGSLSWRWTNPGRASFLSAL